MPRVFLPQRPVYREDGQWKDKYDLAPLERFGRLVTCVEVGNIPKDVGQMARAIDSALADFGPDDHVVALGDPIAIGLVFLALARTGHPVSLLKFDRRSGEYRPVTVGGTTAGRGYDPD
jgi:hypothetical protein